MAEEDQNRKIAQVIAKCWADDDFKQKLLADAKATLKAAGVEIAAGRSIKVLEDTGTVMHLVIPAKPVELSDETLDRVAGGKTVGICGCRLGEVV
jgi:hypothetical protein